MLTVSTPAAAVYLAAQQVINAGAPPEEVKQFLKQLEPLYQPVLSLEKMPVPVIEQPAPRDADLAVDAAGRERVNLGEGYEFDWWQEVLINAALVAIAPVGIIVGTARVIALASNVTIGLGPAVTFGLGVGVGLGAGLLLTNKGRLGGYGSVEGIVGVIASISATIQVTIVGGGIDRMKGWCWAAGISGGDVVVGNAAALLSMTSPVEFLGVSIGVGLGFGIPFEAFVKAQHTWAIAAERG